jgi:hypothetical protein
MDAKENAMKKTLIRAGLAIALTTTVGGCAQTPRPGEVVMKASTTEAHITLPAANVTVGDKVTIYRDVHTGGRHGRIEQRLIGEGTVTRLMGEKYAVVEVPAGVEFQQGDYAERK